MDGSRSSEAGGRGNSSSRKGTQGLLRAGDGAKPAIRRGPAGDPLTRGEVVDKLSRFYSAFPRCSTFSHFIYPVRYSFKPDMFLCFKAC